MFSWKKFETYSMETPGESLPICGTSVAARGTSFAMRRFLLDCGIPSDGRPKVIVITHMHLDHIDAIVRYFLAAEQTPGNMLIIICPAGSVDYLRDYIETGYRATKRIPKSEPVPLPPHKIIGATIGPTNCSVILDSTGHSNETVGFESTTYELTEAEVQVLKRSRKRGKKKSRRSRSSGASSGDDSSGSATLRDVAESKDTDENKIARMKKPWRIEAIRCNHGGQPTTGYGFSEIRERMKEEYLTTNVVGKRVCKLTPEELRERKRAGTIHELKETVEIPLFAYVCDTDHKAFLSTGKHEGYKLDKYPVIIVECTFFEPGDVRKAKNDKHMHWHNLQDYISAHPDKYFKLMHFSNRYSSADLDKFQSIIDKKFPTPTGDTPHVVLLRNGNEDVDNSPSTCCGASKHSTMSAPDTCGRASGGAGAVASACSLFSPISGRDGSVHDYSDTTVESMKTYLLSMIKSGATIEELHDAISSIK